MFLFGDLADNGLFGLLESNYTDFIFSSTKFFPVKFLLDWGFLGLNPDADMVLVGLGLSDSSSLSSSREVDTSSNVWSKSLTSYIRRWNY